MEWEKRSAFVFIKCYPGKSQKVFDMLREWNNALGVFNTTGQWDLMVWLDTESIEDAYKWISKIRYWPEVENTSTHQTYYGWKNEKPFWEKPAWSWIRIRSNDIYSTYEELKMFDWIASVASIPGDWDCVAAIYGDSYQDIFNYIWELTSKGYEVEYNAPLRTYWNKQYLETWDQKLAEMTPARTY